MMKYYKLGEVVYAYELDGSQDDYIKEGSVRMTDNEVKCLLDPDGTLRYIPETDSVIRDDELVNNKRIKEQDEVWEKIKIHRDELIASGVYVTSLDKRFHTDEKSTLEYAKISTSILLGIFEPTNWKTMDGDFIKLTEKTFIELQLAINVQTQHIFAKAEYHKQMMLEMKKPLNYKFDKGW